jgi:hypothetical protein
MGRQPEKRLCDQMIKISLTENALRLLNETLSKKPL